MKATAHGLLLVLGVGLIAACNSADTGGSPAAQPTPPSASPAASMSPAARQALERCGALYRRGDLAGALAAARSAVLDSPGAPEPYRLFSKICLDTGRNEQALEFFRQLTAQSPATPLAWFHRGLHEYHLNRWRDALASFEHAAQLDSGNAECYARQGLILDYLGEFDRAEQAFRRAYELEPDSAVHAARYVKALRVAGRYDRAEEVLEKALAVSPDSAELRYALAQMRLRDGHDAEAEQALRRAIELDPKLTGAHKDLAGLLFRSGREAEARTELVVAGRLTDYARQKTMLLERVTVNPDHPQLALVLAELELTEGRPSDSLRWFARAQLLAGPSDRIHAGRAEALVAAGNVAAAEDELLKLTDRESGRARLARAAVLAARGERQEAAHLLDAAVTEETDDRDYLRRAADINVRIGRRPEAVRLLARAAEIPRQPVP